MILNYVKTWYANYKTKFCTDNIIWPCSNFKNTKLLYNNRHTKTQSVLYNYAILLNWENITKIIQFHFLKLSPPSLSILASSPISTSPPLPLKQKKIQPPSKKKVPQFRGGGRHESGQASTKLTLAIPLNLCDKMKPFYALCKKDFSQNLKNVLWGRCIKLLITNSPRSWAKKLPNRTKFEDQYQKLWLRSIYGTHVWSKAPLTQSQWPENENVKI